ncbi:sulfur oxidation c-type cytochrome SoxX [Reyranella sp.]|jgi:sulfur-oxidizing protein SoxX|uniref:sulfur oxidation c-type cytochrome SoxX n=1 Tax=Reyranella sp. TaxID=1929291 RepID=UPI002F936BD0
MRATTVLAVLLTLCASGVGAQEGLRSYVIVGDAIPDSLTGKAGDAARGRAIVADRSRGLCLLCHSAPIPDERFQGNLASDLAGAGTRWTAGQLRLRLVDASRLKADTIMPSYYRLDDLQRVARTFAGKPVLDARQIEDVVAYLASLKQ